MYDTIKEERGSSLFIIDLLTPRTLIIRHMNGRNVTLDIGLASGVYARPYCVA